MTSSTAERFVLGDKAYESDELDRQMQEHYGIEMIAPHRHNRAHPAQDGRSLRRYRRRWTIDPLRGTLSRPTERLIWLDINPTEGWFGIAFPSSTGRTRKARFSRAFRRRCGKSSRKTISIIERPLQT